MTDKPDEEKDPKIIIDEGWKAEVEAEKEALRQKEGGAEAEPPEPAPKAGPDEQAEPFLPASLLMLATTLATQAMVAMGLVPDPLTNKAEVRMDHAKHFIDTLQVLQEKTEGNRTPEESEVLDGMLHELRMGYISTQGKGTEDRG